MKMIKERFINAKRGLLDKLYCNLNEEQREAVFTVDGPLLVLAGAGSGKTTVLVNRIGYMIRYGNLYYSEEIPDDLSETMVEELEKAVDKPAEEIAVILDSYAKKRVEAWSVLSITFTNKAANEMKERLAKHIGDESGDIWAGTFHSVCVRLLRKFSDKSGYGREFTIYDSDDSKKLITLIISDNKLDEKSYPPRTVLGYISDAKNQLITAQEYEKTAKDYRETQIAKLYSEYQERLKSANALDFDDIIMETVRMLQDDEEVRGYCQNRFKYVCVDEYQDTNGTQFELIRLISGKYNNLMVVGDDDQSIYKFRGAKVENILNFNKEIENVKTIKLERNYRSTSSILDVANEVISKNETRLGKNLWTSKDGGAPVCIRQLYTQNDEGRFIVDKILELKKSGEYSFNDFGVLYRLNALSNSLEGAFSRSGIPYRILGGLRFYERKEIKDVLAYLSVISNPSDELRLQRIINEPKRKIGETTVNAVLQLARHYNKSAFEIMLESDKYVALSKASQKLKEFTSLISGLREISEAEPVSVLIDKVLEMTGYREMLYNAGQDGKERLENVEEMISNAVEFDTINAENNSLAAFLEEVSLVADIDNYNPESDAVVLMTVHSAKGLEFPVVFLPGMEEGIFPSSQALYDNSEIEEERRLAYVAVTRAKERLYCTYSKERLLYGKTSYNALSRFLAEVPQELFDRKDCESKTQDSPMRRSFPSHTKQKVKISDEFYKTPSIGGYEAREMNKEFFKAGDMIRHLTFGTGMVLSVKDMKGDAMYEIAFESVGTKKMMATYAKLERVE